jgi:hypothetical protein
MKNLTSKIGWALLLAVLAVPSFLFYNWWTSNKLQASAELAPDQVQTNIFPSAEKDRAPQPAAVQSSSPVQQPEAKPVPAAPKPAATAAPLPARPAAAPQPSAPAQQEKTAPAPAASAPAQPVQASTAPAHQVVVSTGPKPTSYYSPKSDRDPILSPADYSRMKEAELRRLENERAMRLAANRRTKEPQIESRMQLQGIVGNAAIINGEMYSAGQTIYGAKILKVGANYVIGEYKGRKFRKVLQ